MGFFDRLRKGLSKSRGNLTERVDELVENTAVVDDDFYEELTDILLLSDVGVRASTEIIDELRRRVEEKKVKDARTARQMFKDLLVEEMNIPRPALHWPMVMFVVGVNGVGKTTTVGKLALRFQEIGRSVILAAADTFRAAADDQLSVWAERAHVPLIKHQMGSDPAAVVFDAVQAAKARKADLLIIDTAGRLHNKKNLMEELSKMRRIIDREYSEATHADYGRDHRPERPEPGQDVQGRGGNQRHHPDQAGWHRQGRRGHCHPPRAECARGVYRRGRGHRRFAGV